MDVRLAATNPETQPARCEVNLELGAAMDRLEAAEADRRVAQHELEALRRRFLYRAGRKIRSWMGS